MADVIQQHFVTFVSPGTFFAEESTKPIDAWNVETARAMATEITERYDAQPYCFFFTTRGRGEADLDSRQTARSPNYFIGCTVRTLEEVEREDRQDEDILRRNMRNNGFARVATPRIGWRVSVPVYDEDVVLDYDPAN